MHDIRELITKRWGATITIDFMHNRGTHYEVEMKFHTERYIYFLRSEKREYTLKKFNRETHEFICEHTCTGAIQMFRFMKYLRVY